MVVILVEHFHVIKAIIPLTFIEVQIGNSLVGEGIGAVPSILLFRFQFDTQEVSPRRLHGITEVMLLVQLRHIEAMLKDTLRTK